MTVSDSKCRYQFFTESSHGFPLFWRPQSVSLQIEIQLDALLSLTNLSLVTALTTVTPPNCASVYPGFLAAKPGHPTIGRAIEHIMYAVAVHSRRNVKQIRDEMVAYLGRHFAVDKLEIWRLRRSFGNDFLGIALRQSLGHDSLDAPLHLGTISLQENETGLFLLVSGQCRCIMTRR